MLKKESLNLEDSGEHVLDEIYEQNQESKRKALEEKLTPALVKSLGGKFGGMFNKARVDVLERVAEVFEKREDKEVNKSVRLILEKYAEELEQNKEYKTKLQEEWEIERLLDKLGTISHAKVDTSGETYHRRGVEYRTATPTLKIVENTGVANKIKETKIKQKEVKNEIKKIIFFYLEQALEEIKRYYRT